MFINKNASRTVRGFTLTEAAIVLGIVGLILSAIWVAAGAVYTNYRTSKTSEQILTIAQNMRSLHAQVNVIDAAFTVQQLIQAGGLPSDMVVGLTAQNIWGLPVTISRGTTTIAGDTFIVSYDGVPANNCGDIVSKNTGGSRDTGLTGVTVNASGTAAPAGPALSLVPPASISVTQAVTACQTPVNTPKSVHFYFRLKG